MKIEIRSILGIVLFEFDGESLREAVIAAIKKRANLRGANLRDANLRGANLRDADLRGANLMGANLRDADLMGANLRDADLRDADLMGANLRGANLMGANLRDANNAQLQCPEIGSFTAFKKCARGRIVTLIIPEDAKRSSATSRKCRADKAVVLRIEENGKEVRDAVSDYDNDFVYRTGETVSVDNFEEDRWEECAAGIHFFITRKEAEEY